jgi:hypothetical protein
MIQKIFIHYNHHKHFFFLKFYHYSTYQPICMYGSTLIIHMKVKAVMKKNCVVKPKMIKNVLLLPDKKL